MDNHCPIMIPLLFSPLLFHNSCDSRNKSDRHGSGCYHSRYDIGMLHYFLKFISTIKLITHFISDDDGKISCERNMDFTN